MTVLLFETALDTADDVVRMINSDQIGLPTAYEGLTIGQVLNEMINDLALLPQLLSGTKIEMADQIQPLDRLGGNPERSWQAHAETARRAVALTPAQQIVHVPGNGKLAAVSYLEDMARDIIIRTWDLARGMDLPFHIEEETARALYAVNQGKVAAWRRKGLPIPVVTLPAGASNEAKLLALFGREL